MAEPPGADAPYPRWAGGNRGPFVIAVMGSMTALALLFSAARIYCRLISVKRLAIEEYIVMSSIVLLLSNVSVGAVAVANGLGRHIATLPPENAQRAIFFTTVAGTTGILSFTFPKFAVVILLAKILDPGRWHRRVMWLISIVYFIMSVVTIIIIWAHCTPAAAQWGAVKGKCWDPAILFIYAVVHGILWSMFDLYLAIYPSGVVFSTIRINRKKKLALSTALGFGYCAGAIAAYKCYTLIILLTMEQDFTYTMPKVMLWTNIEGNCVLIGACIPCLYPLVKKLFGPKALGSTAPAYRHPDAVATIGSHPKERSRGKRTVGDTYIDETVGGISWKHNTLEESPANAGTAEQWAAEAVAELGHQQEQGEEQEQWVENVEPARKRTPPGWI